MWPAIFLLPGWLFSRNDCLLLDHIYTLTVHGFQSRCAMHVQWLCIVFFHFERAITNVTFVPSAHFTITIQFTKIIVLLYQVCFANFDEIFYLLSSHYEVFHTIQLFIILFINFKCIAFRLFILILIFSMCKKFIYQKHTRTISPYLATVHSWLAQYIYTPPLYLIHS
jgi:hypothetical protein